MKKIILLVGILLNTIDGKAMEIPPVQSYENTTGKIAEVIANAQKKDPDACDRLIKLDYEGFLNFEHLNIDPNTLLTHRIITNLKCKNLNESQIYFLLRHNPQNILFNQSEGYWCLGHLLVSTIEEKHQKSDPFFQFCQALIYDFGRGKEKDQNEATKYYRNAAELSCLQAQCMLGAKGLISGCIKKEEALEWLETAAENNFARAQFNMGAIYSKNEHVEGNIIKSANFLKKSADQGFANAQYNLGNLLKNCSEQMINPYEESNIIPALQIIEDALKYFKLASDQGHLQAKEKWESMQEYINIQKGCY